MLYRAVFHCHFQVGLTRCETVPGVCQRLAGVGEFWAEVRVSPSGHIQSLGVGRGSAFFSLAILLLGRILGRRAGLRQIADGGPLASCSLFDGRALPLYLRC